MCLQPAGPVDSAVCQPGPDGDQQFGGYEDALFAQAVLRTVEQHHDDAAAELLRPSGIPPLYLFWAPHIAHAPLQCPQQYLDHFAFIAPTDQVGAKRQTYHAMVRFADDAVANLTALLRRNKMWADSLIVFSGE